MKETKRQQRFRSMREAKASKRLESPAPEYPRELPQLRRRIVIYNYDFGEEVHTLDCYKTDRIDCFRVYVDGKLWQERIGFSRILAGIRKAMPRITSI